MRAAALRLHHGAPPPPPLADLDPCWRAVRELGDDKAHPAAAQLLASLLVTAYELSGSNPYLDAAIAPNAACRLLRLASDEGEWLGVEYSAWCSGVCFFFCAFLLWEQPRTNPQKTHNNNNVCREPRAAHQRRPRRPAHRARL